MTIDLDALPLFNQLVALTHNWNDYEDIPCSQQRECTAIGKKLDAAGGKKLMCEAYYFAKAANPHVHVIQAYWNGIGDWW